MKRIFTLSLAALIIVPFIPALTGCGPDNPPVVEDAAKTQARVDMAKQQRELYDKCGGDFDKLSPEDQATANKLMNGHAKEGFAKMGGGGG